jgi:predicted peptidase
MKKRVKIIMICSFIFIAACASTSKINLGNQTPQKFRQVIRKAINMDYLLYLPKDYQTTKKKKFPLMLFLHGAGERGTVLKKVAIHGPAKLIKQGKEFPFIVVSPQCPPNEWWNIDVLNELLNEITKKFRIDENRIYVTGLSMGGYGTWSLALTYPDRFAAIAPICGGGNPLLAESIKHLPIWVFHGAQDEIVPLKNSQDMVDALEKVGGKVKFTIYPEAGHDSWTETYDNPDLYEWLLSQSKNK